MIKSIPGVIAVYPVYSIPGPESLTEYIQSKSRDNDPTAPVIAHDLTGVGNVHDQLKNFGNGVRVAVIDTGIDYKHPALGGCYGLNCKVAFGLDLVGDNFSSLNPVPVEDNDPIDNCSDSSHGTHVAGIIAANATEINETGFIPFQSFVGVAPQAILGSCLQTGGSPSISAGAIAVASLDNLRAPRYYLFTPDDEKIFYLPGAAFGGWQSVVQSEVVVNSKYLFKINY
ncbi:unnamed protein product [Rotaria sp. Silwood2]|nr:unnamed protein product [Rotaria sp. Silwood2]